MGKVGWGWSMIREKGSCERDLRGNKGMLVFVGETLFDFL